MADGDGGTLAGEQGEVPPRGGVTYIAITARTLWLTVAVVLVTLVGIWALSRARDLAVMLVLSVFFGLALIPGVNVLQRRFGWRRGAAVGVIYLAGFVALFLMIAVLIPGIVELAQRIGESGAQWLAATDDWLSDTFGIELLGSGVGQEVATEVGDSVGQWAQAVFGTLLGVASSGIGFVFNMATVAMFTFYVAADFPRLERSFLAWFSPAAQQRLGWTIDQAIMQTGGYLYSRSLLMLINGTGFFATMVAVGMPVSAAIPLALIGSFVSVFIPVIGTYIGGAIPVILTLAIQGWIPALAVLGYVLVYQQIENYWLSPKLSSKTMTLNSGLAFGAALAGGALAGPMGAFMALPIAALITAFVSNYRRSYEVVYESAYLPAPAPPAEV
jgi:predicted PurR-regulated permease PerM